MLYIKPSHKRDCCTDDRGRMISFSDQPVSASLFCLNTTNLNVYWYDNYNNYGHIIEDNELQYTWETIDLTKISG